MMSSILSIPTASADEVIADPGLHELLFGELRVRGRRGVDDKRFRVAHVGEVREQLDAVDERLAGLEPALHAEHHDAAVAVLRYFLALACVGWLSRPGYATQATLGWFSR